MHHVLRDGNDITTGGECAHRWSCLKVIESVDIWHIRLLFYCLFFGLLIRRFSGSCGFLIMFLWFSLNCSLLHERYCLNFFEILHYLFCCLLEWAIVRAVLTFLNCLGRLLLRFVFTYIWQVDNRICLIFFTFVPCIRAQLRLLFLCSTADFHFKLIQVWRLSALDDLLWLYWLL